MMPNVLLTVDDYRREAVKRLPQMARDYYQSGSEAGKTLFRNEKAFASLLIRPRCLRSVAKVTTSVEWFGATHAFPIGIAPTAFHKMATFDGELDTVRGAAAAGTVMICSSWSTTSIEEIGEEARKTGAVLWFQLYVYKDRDATESLIRRAEKAGVKALVLTVDTPVLGRRLADTLNGFSLPSPLKFANFENSVTKAEMPTGGAGKSGFMQYVSAQIDPSLSWETLRWIRTKTDLPILVKGVMTSEDAELALKAKVDGIIVSNHGGRQMDDIPATIEVLPEVIQAVGKDVPVFLDGGIRNGRDVFKAIALGARGVFVGRPILWGLTVGRDQGVRDVLAILQSEFLHALQLTGIRSIEELQGEKNVVVHKSAFSKI
ncbi:unnamed protein product [Caenorhabditis auriculariae]|uniref:FMN hydroxy acid dehydrogenase domain-containing protein n=1 Tax=Caenorhabditis auriculariae TaxID=2777116 RepID=A0A8S1HRG1_9PELO|nr:unnamed protein product [Caenorhabditis auriculariae]